MVTPPGDLKPGKELAVKRDVGGKFLAVESAHGMTQCLGDRERPML